ncbi:MAG: BMP family ABC transporter substrate-binding protein [Lachnospiraceae bacterium]|nr:BMP family ABC transporter substrate-binding protein [Lachnospiraceae bacterium]
MTIRNRIAWSNTRILTVIAGAILLAALIGMLFIRDTAIDTDITSKTTNVGLVLSNTREDANYCQTHYDSLMNLKDELNLEIFCREKIMENEDCFDAMKELIEEDRCSIIIAPSFGYAPYVKEMAVLYPDICFIQPMGTGALPNMTTCSGRMYQARYLSGIVAGMHSRTAEIGYVAAFAIPEVVGQINAFTLGVRSVAADAAVHVIYCNSWVDDAEAEKASKALLDMYPEVDMLTMHTNSLMPNRVAKDRGISSIGFNRDNAELFPGSWLTACVWNWEDYYRQKITSSLQGKFYGRHEWVDMEDGIIKLSELTEECVPGTKERVDEAAGRFKNRSFDVFYGPVFDNTGRLRVPEKESMSDEMLNSIDWYVEGVTVEE